MSADAQLSKASYFKANSATLSREGCWTAGVNFSIGSTSCTSMSDSKVEISFWSHPPLPLLLLNTCYVVNSLIFCLHVYVLFPQSDHRLLKVKGQVLHCFFLLAELGLLWPVCRKWLLNG